MARPITDKDRTAVRRLHAKGLTRNDTARKMGRSPSRVSKLAIEAGLTFDRGPEVIATTEARRIDLVAGRTQLAQDLHEGAEKLRAQHTGPCRLRPHQALRAARARAVPPLAAALWCRLVTEKTPHAHA
ncbi:hypothetical protein [Streptomyces sp. NBC_00009]|uniref:hypothetical protein n=1 Tax=Streptomyces sp. NBC_00009 TaxID=2975620 RepID=UPI003255B3A4